jgi:hypothetical protein
MVVVVHAPALLARVRTLTESRPKLLRALIIPSLRRRRAGSLGNAPDFIAITRKLKWRQGRKGKVEWFSLQFGWQTELSSFLYILAGIPNLLIFYFGFDVKP